MQDPAGGRPQPGASDDSMSVLLALLACDAAGSDVAFGFDISNGTFMADIPVRTLAPSEISGSMSLAIYNDLKLSQFIFESDRPRRSGYRRFTLTERGRKVAKGWSA